MAAGTTIKHKRKAGAFVGGELAAGELGLDVTNNAWYYSANGTTVAQLVTGGGVAGLKTYRVTLTQSGAAAPVATVLENTTGVSMTWGYLGVGQYQLTAGSAIFTANKTFVTRGFLINETDVMDLSLGSTTGIQLTLTDAFGGPINGVLFQTAFQLLIYP